MRSEMPDRTTASMLQPKQVYHIPPIGHPCDSAGVLFRVQFKMSLGQPLCVPTAEPYGQVTHPQQTSREAGGLARKNLPGAAISPREAGSKIPVIKSAALSNIFPIQ
jgi:hypothetical protein